MQRYKRYFYFPSYLCILCFYQLKMYFLKNKSIKNLVFSENHLYLCSVGNNLIDNINNI